MDSFKEQIIRKENTSKDSTMRFLIAFACVALSFAVIMFTIMLSGFFPMALFISGLIVYGGVHLIQNLNLEYEYIFTNGDLDIDKVIAARSRKHLATLKVNDATDIGEYKGSDSGSRTIILASAMNSEMQDWYMDIKHADLGDVRLIFTPDDDMLRVIKTHLPRTIRSKVNVSDKPAEDFE
ncbi:DUF6106 family protein [Ruminococcus sp.]|uniref:DUF6106 family protein n=1 Tax=Ruminococcus sp. TaxID=41978 RepID=UPI0025898B4E|nr:DUF6106 family protein [Ruminococcus sp.]MCR5019486.1 DUF6106 family protein [Ruminococcus sp.]